jgi:hypothetical protein
MSQSTFYVEKGYTLDSKVPPAPPQKPTNKPICLGSRTDEEIVYFTKYKFTESVKILLANSGKNRRPRRNSGPPRPQNPFILYRRDKVKKHETDYAGLKSSEVSKIVGGMWNNETPDVKILFEALARLSEKAHSRKYRDYRYKPKQRKPKNDNERYSPAPDSPESDSSFSSSNYSPTSSSSSDECHSPTFSNFSDNEDMILEFLNFEEPNESYDTASSFSALADITPTELSDTSGNIAPTEFSSDTSGIIAPTDTFSTFCNIAPTESFFCTLGDLNSTGLNYTSSINSNDMSVYAQAEHSNLQVEPVASPAPFDERFIMFAYNLYNFIHANPNPPMKFGAESTAFLGSSIDEPNYTGGY